ncbi:hypothetical protein PspR84_21890 [Pseudomonas sp. R84]|nr:hypothetical protein PspR84_21890 [Pseudomonas sp. R84]
MHIKGRCITSVCALLFIQQAMAAGMDCTKAANAVENTVCANKSLYELDAQMGVVYRDLFKASACAQAELKRTQRLWLKTRNECAEDISCLSQQYRERLQALHAQWQAAVAYQPDDLDKQALDDLQKRIQAASKDDPEFALDRALAALAVKTTAGGFDGEASEEDSSITHFPTAQPKGVSANEWRALTASLISDAAETGLSSYTLRDLDGDGQRDLIVNTYAGGTGLFTYVETWRRDGERFVKRSVEPESSLFYTNDRGANQSVDWINLHGKTYAAYRNSEYGVDRVYLLNPLKINVQVPTVTIRYRYDLDVPILQHKDDGNSTFELEPDLHRALNLAVAKVNETAVIPSKEPLCPIPATGAVENDYYSFGPAHYSIEKVADLPVFIGNDCYIGALIDWFGSYREKYGLFAQLALRKPDSDDGSRIYEVYGRRHITDVSTSMGEVELNEG